MHIPSPYKGPRLLILLAIFCGLFVITGLRLYFLQIMQKDFFKTTAQKQYTTTVTLPAERATIYDRQLRPLAQAHQHLSAFINPNALEEPDSTLPFLEQQYPISYLAYKKNRQKHFLWIARNITDQEKKCCEPHTKDIHFIHEPSRIYIPPYATPMVGFTDIDTQGLSGAEYTYNTRLAGTPTTMLCEKEARSTGLFFMQKIVSSGTPGVHLVLSLDQIIHFLVQKEVEKNVNSFQAKRCSTLVINPDTGEVIAMAQAPSFDPNHPGNTDALLRKNHSIASCHEPGSVMKIFSGLAALSEHATDLETIINCEGKITHIDGFKVENWTHLDKIPFWQVIARSSNIGIAKLGKQLGKKLYEHYIKLGFGTTTGIELPGERTGFVNPPDRWSKASPLVLSFGYEVMVTEAQLARALSIIANGGHDIHLTIRKQEDHVYGAQLYTAEAIRSFKEILRRSALGYRITIPGFTVMGKTGTARMVKNGTYSLKDHIFTFAGIIEKNDWKRVIVTCTEQPKNPNLWSLNVTAPLFKRIAHILATHHLLKKT